MEFSAKQIAGILNGTIEGNPDVSVTKLSKIEEGVPGSISFLANPIYTHYLYTTQATLVIINKDQVLTGPVSSTLIKVESAAAAFAKLLEMYNQVKLNKTGISKHAYISESAKTGDNIYAGEFAVISDNAQIGNNVKIYPQVYVGDNVVIGDNTTLFAGVKIYSDTQIGKNCIIHSGTVIGSDGFRFEPQNEEGSRKVPQIGNVIIEDDVEIGANCAIDRATLGSTILRKGVKFDNLIHIAHNVEVGENSYLAACNVVAGSTRIGKNCMFSGQVGIVGHINIGNGAKINAQSGVSKSIEAGKAVTGSPAYDYTAALRSQAIARRLPELERKLKELEMRLEGITRVVE